MKFFSENAPEGERHDPVERAQSEVAAPDFGVSRKQGPMYEVRLSGRRMGPCLRTETQSAATGMVRA